MEVAMAKVFIDGEAGTTGLQIRERLLRRDDVSLISLGDAERKDADARKAAFAEADIGILCLPDAASREAVALCQGLDVKLIDASTAYRVDPGWVYGFPELTSGHAAKVANAKLVSNPGCWSTCALALLRPLLERGLLPADYPLSIFGISGYTGGGKSMIAEYEGGAVTGSFFYGGKQAHKHVPEITTHAGLSSNPMMFPTVGDYAQGMVLQIPLHLKLLQGVRVEQIRDAYADHYQDTRFVKLRAANDLPDREYPQRLNGTNMLELQVLGDEVSGRVTLCATLDNLGKGASGAAVQNMNLMLGLDEATGL
jgi:N-acetyl-gamma-glutamyl-phosphate reductase